MSTHPQPDAALTPIGCWLPLTKAPREDSAGLGATRRPSPSATTQLQIAQNSPEQE